MLNARMRKSATRDTSPRRVTLTAHPPCTEYVGTYKLVVSYQVVLCVRWTQVYVEHCSMDIEVCHGYLAKIHSPERVCVKVRYLWILLVYVSVC